jgi:F-type H+-transporting ATPase subunit b
VDLAVAAAGKLVADKVDTKVSGGLFKDALVQVKSNMN